VPIILEGALIVILPFVYCIESIEDGGNALRFDQTAAVLWVEEAGLFQSNVVVRAFSPELSPAALWGREVGDY
jgi:hypothetical protein